MKILPVVAFLALPAGICAAPGPIQVWEQEPTSIFGIELGAFRPGEHRIPNCPQRVAGDPLPRSMCIRDRRRDAETLSIEAVPLKEIAYSATMHLVDESVQLIDITFDARRYARMKAILSERYAPPHQCSISEARSMGGAVVPAEMCIWMGKKVLITLAQRRDQIDESNVTFEDLALSAKKAKLIEAEIKESASKL